MLSFVMTVSIACAETAITGNFPFYSDGQLIIPRIDTADKAGAYQAAIFVYDQKINAWHLQSHHEAVEGVSIEEAMPLVTSTIPTQVLLHVKGYIHMCGRVGRINQRVIDNKFEVRIYATQIPPDSFVQQPRYLLSKLFHSMFIGAMPVFTNIVSMIAIMEHFSYCAITGWVNAKG